MLNVFNYMKNSKYSIALIIILIYNLKNEKGAIQWQN